MNHLAHFFLASLNENINLGDGMTGAFLGDHIKGKLKGELPSGIEDGIRLHRQIDSFTDQHPVVRRAYRNFESPVRRYAPIITDLVFDHFLARDWHKYSDQSLDKFNQSIFSLIDPQLIYFPDKAQLILTSMKERKTVLSYTDPEFIRRSLIYLSGRFKKANPLDQSFGIVLEKMSALEADFEAFMPELCNFARNHQPVSVC